MEKTFTKSELLTAMCIMECIDLWTLNSSEREDWKNFRDNVGTAELRDLSIDLVSWADRIYDICTEHDPDFFDGVSFDWEVIPLIMDCVEVTGLQSTDRVTKPSAEQAAFIVARNHLWNEYRSDCRREAAKQWCYADLVTDHIEKTEQSFQIGMDPAEHVKWLGEKYDLTPVNEW